MALGPDPATGGFAPPGPHPPGHAPWGPAGPPGAPRPPGPNVGIFLALGCAGALLAAAGLGAVAYFVARRSSPPAAPARPPARPPPPSRAPTADVRGELRDVRHFESEFGKAHHFVGELHNVGADPIGFLTAKITVHDAAGTALGSGSCATLVRGLEPGGKVPCRVVLLGVAAFATHRADVTARPSFAREEPADLVVSDTRLESKRGVTPWTVHGKITNRSAFETRNVFAVVSLYGDDGRIVGADHALVAGGDLGPGQAAVFKARVYDVAAPVSTFQIRPVGYR